MKKVENAKKLEILKLKRALAIAGLALGLGMVTVPSTVYAEDEVLWEDDSSKDTNLTDADKDGVEQTNNSSESKTTETVNDGTVDTSKDTNPKDADKDTYNGNDDDYFDSWTPDDDYVPHIDSDDEVTRKHPPVPKTGDNPWVPVAGVAGVTASLLALYEIRNKLATIKMINEMDEEPTQKLK